MSASSPDASALGRLAPEPHQALSRMRELALETDPELTELCFARVLEIIGAPAEETGPAKELGGRERAFLSFSEKFAFSVAAVGDADVEALLEHAEPVEAYRFIAALYSFEMSARIEVASQSVLVQEGDGR